MTRKTLTLGIAIIVALSFAAVGNVWVGGDGDWLDETNWQNNTPWTDGSLADFNGAANDNRNRTNEIFIGLTGTPDNVAPSAMQTRGGYGGVFAFSGGDLTGTFDVAVGAGNPVVFRRAFSFDGTLNLANGASFTFAPSAPATLTQTVNIPGSATLNDNANADWSGASIILDGSLSVPKTAELAGADITLTGNRTINLIARDVPANRFRGTASGGYDLTLAWNNQGYAQTSGIAGALDYDVNDLTITAGNATIMVAPSDWTTAFENIGGMVKLDTVNFTPRNSADTANLSTLDLHFPLAINSNVALGSVTAIDVQDGGVLGGTGPVGATINVMSDGIVNPGSSVGTLTVTGPTTFASGSTLQIEIAGEDPGQYDVFDSTSDVVINPDSTLELVFIDGYTPSPLGTSFMDVLNWGTLTGTFDHYLITGTTALHVDASLLYTTGELRLIPEPTSLALLGFASLLMLRRHRSSR